MFNVWSVPIDTYIRLSRVTSRAAFTRLPPDNKGGRGELGDKRVYATPHI